MSLQDIKIYQPHKDQQSAINTLISEVVYDSMLFEGVEPSSPDIKNEIARQGAGLQASLSGNPDYFYLIAEHQWKIVATAAIVPVNELIKQNMEVGANTPEIGNMLVDGEFRGYGLGSKMFAACVHELKERNLKDFVLDCGYGESQGFWEHLLGAPDVTLKDYYEPGADHMIWKRAVAKVLK